MAGIVGTLLKDGSVAEAFHQRMLARLQHRGPPRTVKRETPQGTTLITQLGGIESEPTGRQPLVIDAGGLSISTEDTARIREKISLADDLALQGIAAAGIVREGLRVCRSSDGTRPVYYAPLDQGFAFATERKAIWALPSGFVRPLELGEVITFLWNGSSQSQQPHARIRPFVDRAASEANHISALRQQLEASFSRIESSKRCAVLFSGGVDSSLAALMTSESCKKTVLITAASGAARDSRAAEKAAEQLDLEYRLVHLNPDVVWKALPQVIYAIESTHRMDVEIAIPFFLASAEARRRKCRVVVSGQGPDELFAGYAKHETILAEKGPEVLRENLWAELAMTHETDIARDERAIAAQGPTGFFPYLHTGFIQAASKVPTEMLIRIDQRKKRKLIFRKLANSIGLPTRLCDVHKHATQYSSGSAKTLLQSIRANVEEAKRITRRKAEPMVQDVLDFIGNEIGVPTQYGFVGKFNLDLGPTMRLLKKVR